MRTTIEESKVIELLKSSNAEDQELGVIIAYREFGPEWCKETFGYHKGSNNNTRCKKEYSKSPGGSFYFCTEGNSDGVTLIIFDDVTVYIGGDTIACVYPEWGISVNTYRRIDMRENKQ